MWQRGRDARLLLVRTSTQCRLFDDQPRHIWRPAQLGEVSKGASCLLEWEAKKGRIWKQISDARRDLRTDDGYPRVWMFCVPALSGLVLHQLASLHWAGCPVNRMNCYEPLFKAEWTDENLFSKQDQLMLTRLSPQLSSMFSLHLQSSWERLNPVSCVASIAQTELWVRYNVRTVINLSSLYIGKMFSLNNVKSPPFALGTMCLAAP